MKKPFAFVKKIQSALVAIVIPLSLVGAWLIFSKILGNPANFEGENPMNQPLKDNYLGIIYKGGPIVVLLISFQIILLTFIIERFLTILRARGKQNNTHFVRSVKKLIDEGKTSAVITECDKQKGSVANVVKNGLSAYEQLAHSAELSTEQKVDTLRNELEEATQLELPGLNKNLVIISTLASISTLIGLLGTVTGMIKAFAALARIGAPDAVGLANGISQALVTTALGIAAAAVAIVFYNYFVTRIDHITYAIDEASYSILQSFKLKVK